MTKAQQEMIEAAAAYVRRFEGCPVDDMSPELRRMWDAWQAVKAEAQTVAAA